MAKRSRPDDPRGQGTLLSAISNELVGILAREYGRGPTRARTVIVEDMIVCRMLDPFTTAEHTLLRAGRREEVVQLRAAFHKAMAGEITGAVERLTGRRVASFMAQVDVDPDTLVHLFFLEPETGASWPAHASEFHRSFDSLEVAVLVADDHRRFVDANPAASALLRVSPEELRNRTVDDITAPALRPQVDAMWQTFIANGSLSGDYELRAADGTTHSVEFRARANWLPGHHLSLLRAKDG